MFRLGLLICGHVHPQARSLGGDYPALFRSVFDSALDSPLDSETDSGFDSDVDIVPFAVDRGEMPASITDCDAWITSPSRSSVTDDLSWIQTLESFVVEAVDAAHPFVGVCFGHQLLAKALGGRVDRADIGWGVGVKHYDIIEQRPWMSPAQSSVALVASHEDQVTVLPDGATLLATSEYCPIAAFEVGPRCLAIQPHIEFTPAISERLIDLRSDIIPDEIAAAARQTLSTPVDRTLVAHWILRFVDGQR